MKLLYFVWLNVILSLLCSGQTTPPRSAPYDILIRNGLIYDGTGNKPYVGDIGIRGDRIVAVVRLPKIGRAHV